jgi:hypothetical protein
MLLFIWLVLRFALLGLDMTCLGLGLGLGLDSRLFRMRTIRCLAAII